MLYCTVSASAAVVKRRQLNRVTFKLSTVVVNAKAVIQASDDLEPLAAVMPADADERRTYVHQSLTERPGDHWAGMWSLTVAFKH